MGDQCASDAADQPTHPAGLLRICEQASARCESEAVLSMHHCSCHCSASAHPPPPATAVCTRCMHIADHVQYSLPDCPSTSSFLEVHKCTGAVAITACALERKGKEDHKRKREEEEKEARKKGKEEVVLTSSSSSSSSGVCPRGVFKPGELLGVCRCGIVWGAGGRRR